MKTAKIYAKRQMVDVADCVPMEEDFNNLSSIPAQMNDSSVSSVDTTGNLNNIKMTSSGFNFQFGDFKFTNSIQTSFSSDAKSNSGQSDCLLQNDTLCGICSQKYSAEKFTPKVLECGHSVCSACLASLLNSRKNCPKCSASLAKSFADYPTNFDLLSLSISIRQTKCADQHIICSLESMKRKLENIRENLVKNIQERNSLMDKLNCDISKVEEMLSMEKDCLSPKDSKKLLEEAEDTLAKAENVLYCCSRSSVKPTYSLAQYKNTTHFLYDLSIRLHKGELIYACDVVIGRQKYGKILFDEDRIIVHALIYNLPDNASIVSLTDLKKCLTPDNFFTFLKFGFQTLFFELVNSSIETLQFIKLCTGETGPVLQGSVATVEFSEKNESFANMTNANIAVPQHANFLIDTTQETPTPKPISSWDIPTKNQQKEYITDENNLFSSKPIKTEHITTQNNLSSDKPIKNQQKDHITIKKYIFNSTETEGCIDYDITKFCQRPTTTKCQTGEIILRSLSSGTCEILNCLKDSYLPNVVGILRNTNKNALSNKIFNNKNMIIGECGICFKL